MAGPGSGSDSTRDAGLISLSGGRSGTAVPEPTPRWKTRLLLPLGVVAAVVLLLGYSLRDALRPAVAVRVTPVVMRGIEHAQAAGGVVTQAPGWVEPSPYAVTVGALRDGVVSHVLVLEGDPVAAGQVVARLTDVDAKLALAKAQAHVARAQAGLETARQALGDGKTLGPAAAELAAQVKQLPTELARLQAKLAEANLEVTNRKLAVERGLVAPAQVQAAESRAKALKAELDAAGQQEPVFKARMERLKNQLEADARLAQAELATAQAGYDEAKLALERSEVVCPVAGVVMARLVEPGAAVRHGESTVVKVYDPASLQVRVDVPQSQAAKVEVGMEAQIVVDVLPDQTFAGRVARVVPEADIARNTLQFKVKIEKPSGTIKPQMLTRVKFIAQAHEASGGDKHGVSRVFAPTRIVGGEAGSTRQVWTADETGKARQKTVTLGQLRHKEWIEVASGLNPGDRLIVDVPEGLAEGRVLAVQEIQLDETQGAGGRP